MGMLNRMTGAGERRSASLHPGDPKLAELFGNIGSTAAGVNITPENARRCPEVDACVGLIEDTIATVPLDFFERVAGDTRERRNDDPLHELLHDRPNASQTSTEFRQMLEGWRSTHGNAHARINWRGDGIPDALDPMHPLDVVAFRAPNGEVAYRWSPNGMSSQVLLQHEVLHLKDKPFSRDLISGDSRVMRHREAIGRAQATGEYLSRFFSNNAVPKSFLQHEGKPLDPDQVEQLRDQFEARHAGLSNAHKIGILNGGMKLVTLAANNDEAQVIEAFRLSVEQIARAWGIPLHLIGEHSKSTSFGTGIEQQSIGFIVYYMRPKFVMWEQALNSALMSAGKRRKFFFEFNLDGLLRGDFKSRMDGFALMVQWGLATPNEIRRLMNFAPVEGGDERLHPLNMAPASKIMEVLMRNKGGVSERDIADLMTRAFADFARSAALPPLVA
tara:strand:+ start:8529 stop:9863 length:1335 start_codon:yes stop_codon:yes gene_type:complete